MTDWINSLDDRVGQEIDPRAIDTAAIGTPLSPRLDAYLAHLAATNPRKLGAVANGLALTVPGLAAAVQSGLAPFLTLPPAPSRTRTRARLAQRAQELVAANGNVTRDELLASGFTEHDLDTLFPEAARIAGLERMAA